jgi:hypothetical protein
MKVILSLSISLLLATVVLMFATISIFREQQSLMKEQLIYANAQIHRNQTDSKDALAQTEGEVRVSIPKETVQPPHEVSERLKNYARRRETPRYTMPNQPKYPSGYGLRDNRPVNNLRDDPLSDIDRVDPLPRSRLRATEQTYPISDFERAKNLAEIEYADSHPLTPDADGVTAIPPLTPEHERIFEKRAHEIMDEGIDNYLK